MNKNKISNVARRILLKEISNDDPIFSQENESLRTTKKINEPKKIKSNSEIIKKVHLRPTISISSKEKELRSSATKGVVKFLNMVVNYKECANSRSVIGSNMKTIADGRVPNKRLKSTPKIRSNRFGKVVEATSKKKDENQ
ncbi:Rrp15p family protein [Cryptosporidium felis]|nr:Rrp15p family protein [Cryptosporidium felis]